MSQWINNIVMEWLFENQKSLMVLWRLVAGEILFLNSGASTELFENRKLKTKHFIFILDIYFGLWCSI